MIDLSWSCTLIAEELKVVTILSIIYHENLLGLESLLIYFANKKLKVTFILSKAGGSILTGWSNLSAFQGPAECYHSACFHAHPWIQFHRDIKWTNSLVCNLIICFESYKNVIDYRWNKGCVLKDQEGGLTGGSRLQESWCFQVWVQPVGSQTTSCDST